MNRSRPLILLLAAVATACVDDTFALLPGFVPPPPTKPTTPEPVPSLPAGVAVIASGGEVTVLHDHDLLVTSLPGQNALLQKLSPDLEERWRLEFVGSGQSASRIFAVTGDADDFVVAVAFSGGLRVGDRLIESEGGIWIARLTLDGEIVWDQMIDAYFHPIDRVNGRVLASGELTLLLHQTGNWMGFDIRGDAEHSFVFDDTSDSPCYLLRFDERGGVRWARAIAGSGFHKHPTQCSARIEPDGSGFVAAEVQKGANMVLRDPQGTTLASYDNPSVDESRTLFADFRSTGEFSEARFDVWRPMDDWVPYEEGVAQTWVHLEPSGFVFDNVLLDRGGHVRLTRSGAADELRPLPGSGFVATPFDSVRAPRVGTLVFFDDELEPLPDLQFATFEDHTTRIDLTPHPDGYVFVTAYGRNGSEVTLPPSTEGATEASLRFNMYSLLVRVPLPNR